MYMNGNYYSFLNISFFSAIGRLLPIDASRIIVISFLIIINRFREGSLARRSRTKIIIILLFGSPGRPRRAPMKRPGRAGDGRAEHAFASASTNAMHEFVHDPHGLRCAVQARCNSCLVSRGDAPVAPAGQMPRPRPCRTVYAHWALSCAASFFFWVSKPSNSCNQNFSVTKTGPDSLVLTSRPPSDTERRGHPIVVVQCNSPLLSRGRSCGQ